MRESSKSALRRYGLCAGAALCAVALWGAAARFILSLGLPLASGDDATRLVLSMLWAESPFFSPEDFYWLPLQFWIYGAWFAALGDFLGLYWYVFSSAGLMAAAGVVTAMVAAELYKGTQGDRIAAGATGAIWVFALIVPFSVAVNWRIAVSGLSEPVFILAQSVVMLLLVRATRSPTRVRWLALIASLVAFQLTRYEAFPLSFAAWGIGVFCAREKIGSGEGRNKSLAKRLFSGWAVLAVFPAAWIVLNAVTHGDGIQFLRVAREIAATRPETTEASIGARIILLAEMGWRQGWIVLLTGLGGVWFSRGAAGVRVLGLYWACAVAVYFQAAFSNTIGTAFAWRFCAGALWVGFAFSAVALATIFSAKVWYGRPTVAAIVLLAISHVLSWNAEGWGGSIARPGEIRSLEEMARRVRNRDYVIVFEDADPVEGSINLLKVFCGYDKFTEAQWYEENPPVRGRFVYFLPLGQAPASRPDGHAFGRYYFFVDRMPPPPSFNPSAPSPADLVL